MSDVEQAVERLRFEIHPVRAGNPRHKADIRTVLDALEAAEQERDRLRVKAEKWDKLPDFHLAEAQTCDHAVLSDARYVRCNLCTTLFIDDEIQAELTAVREERDRLRKALLALLDALKAPVRPVRSHKDD